MSDDSEPSLVDGVDFDGLRVARQDDGFRFETPDVSESGLSEDELREVAHEHPAYVSNWHYFTHDVDAGEAGTAFLRWLEYADDRSVPERYDALADGVTRTWGELAITASRSDGTRRYDLRNVADRDVPTGDLETYADPLDARGIATFDDDGRYRPLKTAPTLPTGWAFPALSGEDLLAAVDFLYPATVENWHRERHGSLDVTHWRETAERQTGIYDVVDELSPGAVSRAAEACCVDSQCLKRREWDVEAGTEIDVARGEGEFPCREPCSLLIAAAREWALAEREEPETYEFELTPSEKAQVEAIVDAVADGRLDEIREGDVSDPANRYRVRYLRAKRFGDDAGRTDES